MFKKLKDKIAEEVKSSPQRIQQLTQTVSEKINTNSNDDSFFSIGEDDVPSSTATPEPGFSNVSLSTPQSVRVRRSSNSSVASDMSFLPRYESISNIHQFQSDLEISSTEDEDNVSTHSSQLGHLTKEQIYAAFQKSQMRYYKYRGRFTDIANYYRELRRQNEKLKSVLVETQDKALRRVAELREQCSLEQKAKAHLENALRLEIDEKQYIIDTLKTKVNLLQSKSTEEKPELLVSIEEPSHNVEAVTKDLKEAHLEIETLNERLQEYKANMIVFSSKEADFKSKIRELDEANKIKSAENGEILERERKSNLSIAQIKMELHTEIQNRDLEIEQLKNDVETLKSDLDRYETNGHSTRLENLQSQNAKLIEKIHSLTSKCQNYESTLLKAEQSKIENQIKVDGEIKELQEKHSKSIEALKNEHTTREESLQKYFEEKLLANSSDCEDIRARLQAKEDDVNSLTAKLDELNVSMHALKTDHSRLTSENNDNVERLEKTIKTLEQMETAKQELDSALTRQLEDKTLVEFELQQSQAKVINLEEHVKDELKINQQIKEKFEKSAQALENQIETELQRVQTRIEKLNERLRELSDSNEKLVQDQSRDNNIKEELAKSKQALQKKLKEQKTKFHAEIQSLNGEIKAFKEKNDLIQGYINEHKEKLAEYEKASAEKSLQLQKLTHQHQNNEKMLTTEIAHLRQGVEEQETEIRRLTDENVRLQDSNVTIEKEVERLEKYREEFEKKNADLNSQISSFETSTNDCSKKILQLEAEVANHEKNRETLLEEIRLLVDGKSHLNDTIQQITEENERLSNLLKSHDSTQLRVSELTTSNDHLTKQIEILQKEISTINQQLNTLNSQKESLMLENERLREDLTKITLENGLKEDIITENKHLKTQLSLSEGHEQKNKDLINQIQELEHQYSELAHERQLLDDEVQELKISPININNNPPDNGDVDNIKEIRAEHEKEINHLNEKIVQYKSLDLTNRTSIQFYENELQKLKNRNEKLNRKLDETLVTLNHCTELATPTETEYLRNILYNYMLGKESLVLARVIAAVCKFDDSQTDAILQREQQKQTLLGQLGFR